MKCKFGYYDEVDKCDWQPSNSGGFCTEICNPVEHKKLIEDQKRIKQLQKRLLRR